jgi:CubicO group peptidase (beta-lactamase class C family)
MRLHQSFSSLLIFALLSACGGGGGGSTDTSATVTTTSPPAFESPHPDIWETASASEAGFDEDALDSAFEYAVTDGFYTQAVVLIKDGKLIRERYRGITDAEAAGLAAISGLPEGQNASYWQDLFGDRDATSAVTSWSTAKSFTSVLIGMAIEQGAIESTAQSASDFIDEWEADDRASITIQQLLDMRSGLVPKCSSFETGVVGECSDYLSASSGGNIVYAADQLSQCIDREFAVPGTVYPWVSPQGDGAYEAGQFYYSNCDTQVLGEIIFRATGQDPGLFAQQNLFELLNMEADWWRDDVETGQANGNYLTYCCLDSTAQDFAKFGYMFLLGGIETSEGQSYASYVSTILAQEETYRNQFWAYCDSPPYSASPDCENVLIMTVGFDGQYILIDQKNDIVLVRTSLYEPILNASDERKMRLNPLQLSASNWVASLPMAMLGPRSEFGILNFYLSVIDALQPEG